MKNQQLPVTDIILMKNKQLNNDISTIEVEQGVPLPGRKMMEPKGFSITNCMVVYGGYIGHILIKKVTKSFIEGTVISIVDPDFKKGTLLKVPLTSIYYFGSYSHHKTREIVKQIKETYPDE